MNWYIAVVVLLGILPVAYLGVGRLCCQALRSRDLGFTLSLVVGVAATVFIGGILNLTRQAHIWPIWAVLMIGFTGGIVWLREFTVTRSQITMHFSLVGIVVLATFLAVTTQFPPDVFNYADDFMKYFSHPVRMLQTGTVYGSVLSAIGSETLGGQAFLQGALVALLPIEYVNGVDAVLGYTLCLVVAASLAASSPYAGGPLSFIYVIAVVFIEPQYVNISGLYIPALLIMGAIELGRREDGNLALLGLLYAALIAVKTTMIIFVVLHGSAVIIALLVGYGHVGFRRSGALALGTIAFLAPWLLIHVRSYITPRRWAVPDVGSESSGLNLFSIESLPYGSTMANYTLLVCAVILWVGLYIWFKRSRRCAVDVRVLASAATIVAVYAAILYGMGPLSGHAGAIRFFTPVAIGSFSPILEAVLRELPRSGWHARAVLVSAVVVVAGFGSSWLTRITNAVSEGTILPFEITGNLKYQQYNDYVLYGDAKQQLRTAQSFVPAGEPFVAWVNSSFHFDFSRNSITDIDVAGLASSWARFPAVSYVVWDRQGRTVASVEKISKFSAGARERVVGMRTLAAMRILSDAVDRGEILYESGKLSVYRVHGIGGDF